MACTQCEAILVSAQKVIDDWYAYNEAEHITNKIVWNSLYQLESLLKS